MDTIFKKLFIGIIWILEWQFYFFQVSISLRFLRLTYSNLSNCNDFISISFLFLNLWHLSIPILTTAILPGNLLIGPGLHNFSPWLLEFQTYDSDSRVLAASSRTSKRLCGRHISKVGLIYLDIFVLQDFKFAILYYLLVPLFLQTDFFFLTYCSDVLCDLRRRAGLHFFFFITRSRSQYNVH